MRFLKAIIKRMFFFPIKYRLKECGKRSLFEYDYIIEGAKHISVGSGVRAKPRLHIAAIVCHNGVKFEPEIYIGDGVSINYDVHIAAINRISIGKGTLIASKVFITDHYHGETTYESMIYPPSRRILSTKGPVIIGENVWIGEGCCIMPNVTIGDNSIIGANAVVTKDIPPFAIAAGVPAEVIRSVEKTDSI